MTSDHTHKEIEHFMSHDLPERIAKVETSVEHLVRVNDRMAESYEKVVDTQVVIVQTMGKVEVALGSLTKVEPKIGVLERHMIEQIETNKMLLSQIEEARKAAEENDKRLKAIEKLIVKVSGGLVVVAFIWSILGQKILTALGFA